MTNRAPERKDGSTRRIVCGFAPWGRCATRGDGHDANISEGRVALKSVDVISTYTPPDQSGRGVQAEDWLVALDRRDASLVSMAVIAPHIYFVSATRSLQDMLSFPTRRSSD